METSKELNIDDLYLSICAFEYADSETISWWLATVTVTRWKNLL